MNTAVTDEIWDLRLYIKGRYRIRVIDLVAQPRRAYADQIVATPTVVRKLPKPMRTFIGSLSRFSDPLVDVNPRYAD